MIYFISGFITILAIAGGAFYYITTTDPAVEPNPQPIVQQAAPEPLPSIVVDSPTPQTVVSGEIEVLGKAQGSWFFEASFPITLKDQSGVEVAHGFASTAEEWMTTDYVPFIGTVDLTDIAPGQYMLELKKDNPSGEPQNDESITIPVTVQ